MIELFITDAALRRSVYRVFRLPAAHAEKANVLLGDDLVSRQSVTVREARSLGLKGDDRFIVIEGSEAGLARAVELLKDVAPPLEGAKADDVYRRLRSQDEQAASGMGLIFGPYGLQTTIWSSTPAVSTSLGNGSNS